MDAILQLRRGGFQGVLRPRQNREHWQEERPRFLDHHVGLHEKNGMKAIRFSLKEITRGSVYVVSLG